MSGQAIGGIIAGSKVEIVSVERTADDGLLVGLATTPKAWVVISAGDQVDAVEAAWQSGRRVVIPMPPESALMFDMNPAPVSSDQQPAGGGAA